jgi:hypothetical protein
MNISPGLTGSACPVEKLQELTTAAGRIPLLEEINLFIVLVSTNDEDGNLSVVAVFHHIAGHHYWKRICHRRRIRSDKKC